MIQFIIKGGLHEKIHEERGGTTPLSRYSKELDSVIDKIYNSNMANYKSKTGFTLAEVLITLAIVGIVAALTIPNLILKYQEKQTVTRFKWVYSTLANAFTMAVAENGAPENWKLNDPQDMAEILSKYMKVSEKCYYKKGCIQNDVEIVSLTGESRYNNIGNLNTYVKERFNNGVVLFYAVVHNGCSYTQNVDSTGEEIVYKNNCGTLYAFISINELNRLGLDHFAFTVTTKGILPLYYNATDEYVKSYCDKLNLVEKNTNGLTCGEWIRRWNNAKYWYD